MVPFYAHVFLIVLDGGRIDHGNRDGRNRGWQGLKDYAYPQSQDHCGRVEGGGPLAVLLRRMLSHPKAIGWEEKVGGWVGSPRQPTLR
jgi:hypothetical protein